MTKLAGKVKKERLSRSPEYFFGKDDLEMAYLDGFEAGRLSMKLDCPNYTFKRWYTNFLETYIFCK